MYVSNAKLYFSNIVNRLENLNWRIISIPKFNPRLIKMKLKKRNA